jgi:hypothetical protein
MSWTTFVQVFLLMLLGAGIGQLWIETYKKK